MNTEELMSMSIDFFLDKYMSIDFYDMNSNTGPLFGYDL